MFEFEEFEDLLMAGGEFLTSGYFFGERIQGKTYNISNLKLILILKLVLLFEGVELVDHYISLLKLVKVIHNIL
jgi:hypothetical protein